MSVLDVWLDVRARCLALDLWRGVGCEPRLVGRTRLHAASFAPVARMTIRRFKCANLLLRAASSSPRLAASSSRIVGRTATAATEVIAHRGRLALDRHDRIHSVRVRRSWRTPAHASRGRRLVGTTRSLVRQGIARRCASSAFARTHRETVRGSSERASCVAGRARRRRSSGVLLGPQGEGRGGGPEGRARGRRA
jgi:hypothetical protein